MTGVQVKCYRCILKRCHGSCVCAISVRSNVNMFTFFWLVSFPVLQTPEEAESYCCRINRLVTALMTAPPAVDVVSSIYSTCGFTAARLFFLHSSVYHVGNQGLMDILDMPNTNKYSFEGWANTILFYAFFNHTFQIRKEFTHKIFLLKF